MMCWLSKLFKSEKEIPKIELLSMPSTEVDTEIRALGQKLMYPCLLDAGQDYYYTKAEDWAEVFDYIYFNFPLPKYVVARMDCEDFGIWLKGLVSALFGLNYFALAIGDIPEGRHSFDFFRTDEGHLLIEPQTGNIFGWLGRGYEPQWALL